jgi:hydrogenase expression/formation protein HypC
MCLAAPAKVISITDREAVVDYNGVRTIARLDTLTDPVSPGDYVLIHTGFAIQRLSPEDGEETLKLFDELAESLATHDEAYSDLETDLSPGENASRSRVGDEANSLDLNDVSSDEAYSDPKTDLSTDENALRSREGDEANSDLEADLSSDEAYSDHPSDLSLDENVSRSRIADQTQDRDKRDS